MTDQQEKLSFLQMLSLIGFGYKLAAKLTPTFLPMVLIRAFCIAAQPLLVLFFSARVLNELDGSRDVQAIITYVTVTVGATFILLILRAFLTRALESVSSYEIIYQHMRMMQAERFAKMDFAHAEDSSISEVLARMDTQARGSGLGLVNVYQLTTEAAQYVFSMVLAGVMLFGPLAYSVSGEAGWPLIALYGAFVLGVAICLILQRKSQLMLKSLFEENAKANTAIDYYREYIKADQAAKDIRLYEQTDTLVTIFWSSFDLRKWSKFFFFRGRMDGVLLGLLAVLSGGYYLITGYGALDGALTVGGIVQSVGSVTIFAIAVGALIMTLGQMFNNAMFLKPMKEYMSLPDLLV